LSQYVLYDFFTHYDIDDHLKQVRLAYKEQCDSMKEMICRYLPEEVKMTSPHGGMFIWLTLPDYLDSEELIGKCIHKGMAFVPGRSFFTTGEGNQHIRMNFSNSNPETIEKGMKILGDEMKKKTSNTTPYPLKGGK